MSPQAEQQSISSEEMEAQVADYLAAHPGFFEQHSELLMELRLPHTRGEAVSLVERQLAALREKCAGYEQKLETLMEVGHKNDILMDQLHSLTLALIEAANLDEVLTVLEDHLHKQFQADAVELRLFSPAVLEDASGLAPSEQEGFAQFHTFFSKGLPLCGRLTRGQLDYLFGPGAEDVRSTALLPLRGESIVGMLAIGSGDEGRFHGGMGTDFLRRLAEVASKRLELVSEPGA
jgi:uncharacterized protein YigA (DUF484 family)